MLGCTNRKHMLTFARLRIGGMLEGKEQCSIARE